MSEAAPLKDQVIIIDQAVPISVQNLIEDVALGNKISWFRNRRATYDDGAPITFPVTPDSVEVHQFGHTIFEDKQPLSPLFPSILPVITAIPYTIKQLLRIKMNLCVYAQLDNPNAHGMPHVDFSKITEPLLTAIYCVNDSTGDTLIFDQRVGQSAPLTVKTRVPPKKGRLVVFDGGLLHAGNTPRTNTPRVNINLNAFVYEGAQVSYPTVDSAGAPGLLAVN
jgi:hypothetical protein